MRSAAAGRVQRGAGTLAPWEQQPLPAAVADALSRMRLTGRPQTVTAAGGTTDGAEADTAAGTIRVELEPVDGIFIEGFEIGLRFETPDGQVISSTLWTDHVQSLGEPDMDAYYESECPPSSPECL